MQRFDESHRTDQKQSTVLIGRAIQTQRQEQRLADVEAQKEQDQEESERQRQKNLPLNPLTEWSLCVYIMKHIYIYLNVYLNDVIKIWPNLDVLSLPIDAF